MGNMGPRGSQGPKGDKGGDSTVPGPMGNMGPRGLQGPKGDQGGDSTVPGPMGNMGPQGLQGPKGDKGGDSTVPGPSGGDMVGVFDDWTRLSELPSDALCASTMVFPSGHAAVKNHNRHLGIGQTCASVGRPLMESAAECKAAATAFALRQGGGEVSQEWSPLLDKVSFQEIDSCLLYTSPSPRD